MSAGLLSMALASRAMLLGMGLWPCRKRELMRGTIASASASSDAPLFSSSATCQQDVRLQRREHPSMKSRFLGCPNSCTTLAGMPSQTCRKRKQWAL